MNLNKVMLIGRLTRDPELRTTPSGQSVATMGLATSRTWNDKSGQKQDQTEFHNIVAWQKLGELCAQLLKKGTKVYVEGRLQTREWDGQDGQKNRRTEIVIDDMIILDSKRDSVASGNQETEDQTMEVVEEINTDDLPF